MAAERDRPATSVHADGDGVCAVVGALDLAGVEVLRRWLQGADPVTAIDLAGVTFIDATGLRCLDDLDGVTLRRPSRAVRRLLEIVGEPDRFPDEP